MRSYVDVGQGVIKEKAEKKRFNKSSLNTKKLYSNAMIPPSFFALDSFLMIRASTLVTSSQDVPLRSREVLSLSTHRQWKWRRLSKWKWTTIIITKTERSRSIFQVPLSTLLLLKTHETALVVGVFLANKTRCFIFRCIDESFLRFFIFIL